MDNTGLFVFFADCILSGDHHNRVMQAVILSFDSLTTHSLGCYGNEWVETPNLDRLASAGIVFDHHFADVVDNRQCLSWATGRHAATPPDPSPTIPLGQRLRSSGVASRLITSGEPADWQRQAALDEIRTVPRSDGVDIAPGEVTIARLVETGLANWKDSGFREQSRLLWLHSPGPATPPRGFESLYDEDFEERGQAIAELSDEAKAQHPASYGGSVSLIDYWLGALVERIAADSNSQPTLLIVTAARGHLWYAADSSADSTESPGRANLSDQCLRTPLVLRFWNDNRYAEFGCQRSNRLVQTCDLVPTLLDWFSPSTSGLEQDSSARSWLREMTEQIPPRDRLQIDDNQFGRAVRTLDWLCVRQHSSQQPTDAAENIAAERTSLFVKPDDIWDVNDMATQQPDVVSNLLPSIVTEPVEQAR